MSDQDGRFGAPPPRERVFNVPPTVLLIALSMPVLYFFQIRLPDGGVAMAFAPADLQAGRWGGLFTALLLHAGWTHAIMNAVLVIAFGAPVARLVGDRVGPTVFLVFCLCAGAFANFGYAVIHWGAVDPIGGSSGVVFGLVGAAMRLLGGKGRILPLWSGRVMGAACAWIALSLIAGTMSGLSGGAPGFAWEINILGLVFGLLAIGPLGRLFGRGPAEASETAV